MIPLQPTCNLQLRVIKSEYPPPPKLDFNSQLRVYITQFWEKSQNSEKKGRIARYKLAIIKNYKNYKKKFFSQLWL